MPKLLTDAAVEQFHEQGYCDPVPVLDANEVADFRDRLEAFEREHPDDVAKLKTKSHLLCPWVVEIARHSRVLDAYEDIIGPDILCYSMAFRIKNADGRTIAGWHQDTLFLPIEPVLVIGALALSECGTEQGCLQVIPGSHKGPILPHGEAADPNSILARGQFIETDFDKSSAVDLALKPGELGMINSGVIHGSGINSGDDRRIMLLVEMMPTHARSHRQRESAMLVRGTDTYDNHDPDRPAEREFGPEEQATWLASTKSRGENIFADSALPVTEAYGGPRAPR
jgi:ectoine hydroxylase-related dioxygenase (phytanoyl-CoA dioxygenase family)